MGDRANILIYNQYYDADPVVLYTHWDGEELPETLRTALAKRWRWDDSAYLARIVFDVMTVSDHGDQTGFGISTRLPDNTTGRPLLVLHEGQVFSVPEGAFVDGRVSFEGCSSLPFDEYIAFERTWDNLTKPAPA